jgi:hypothetical protein
MLDDIGSGAIDAIHRAGVPDVCDTCTGSEEAGMSKLDGAMDAADKWGQKSGLGTLGQNRWSRAIWTLARNRPFLGSLTQGAAWGATMFVFLSLVTLGRHELRLLAICAGGALLFAAWMFIYNYRHSKSDRDLTAPPSAETNRLTRRP